MLDISTWNTLKPRLEREKYIGSLCQSQTIKIRQFLAIVLHVLKTGITWTGLRRLGRVFEAAYRRFLRWAQRGIFARLFEATVPEGVLEEAQIDSTYMKAHRYAYGKKGAIGTGRGGPTTKVHGLCDGCGIWHRLLLSPGNHHDAPYAPHLVEAKRIQCLLADRAYDNDAFLKLLETEQTKAVIPSKRNRKVQRPLDTEAYKRRHVIENGWLTLKDNCRLALRRDKYDSTFTAFLALAAALSNLKKLVT